MTTVLLYWNHICVLHKGEKQFLDRLAERLSNEDIDLRVRYFGLGYPEHMSEYMARPDAILPDLIVSADLEVFEDSRIYRKLEKDLYPVTKWFPLRDGGALDAVRRDNRLLPFVSIPLVYYTRQPDICERTALKDWDGLAFGGINNSAARRVSGGSYEPAPDGAGAIYLRPPGGWAGDFSSDPAGGACAGAIILLRPHLRTGTSSPPGGREHSVSRAVPVLCGAGGPDPLPGLSGHT